MKQPKFSVCIAAYKDGFIQAALESVLLQSEGDFEVLIGDDSGGKIEGFVSKFDDERIRYIKNSMRLGYAGNHCSLIAKSKGRFIAFLQHDDTWHPSLLAHSASVLEGNPNIGILITGSNDIDLEGRILAKRPTRMQGGLQDDPMRELLSRNCMVFLPSATVVRQEAVRADMKPWPDTNVADLNMYVDLIQAGWAVYYLDEPLLGYRMHPNQLSGSSASHRNGVVETWSGYTFPVQEHEQMRRRVLAGAYLARAGSHLRSGHAAKVRPDLREARMADRDIVGARWIALWTMSLIPGLVPLAIRLRKLTHDPVRNRFKGI